MGLLSGFSNDQMISIVVFGSLSALSGLAALGCVANLLRLWLRSRSLARAPGRVVAHQAYQTRMNSSSGMGSRRVTLVRPVIQFVVHGRPYQILSPIGSRSPAPVGTVMPVAYPPDNPAAGELDSPLTRYAFTVGWLFGLGVTFSIVVSTGISAIFYR